MRDYEGIYPHAYSRRCALRVARPANMNHAAALPLQPEVLEYRRNSILDVVTR